jgi:hypothetical protein
MAPLPAPPLTHPLIQAPLGGALLPVVRLTDTEHHRHGIPRAHHRRLIGPVEVLPGAVSRDHKRDRDESAALRGGSGALARRAAVHG